MHVHEERPQYIRTLKILKSMSNCQIMETPKLALASTKKKNVKRSESARERRIALFSENDQY